MNVLPSYVQQQYEAVVVGALGSESEINSQEGMDGD